MDIIFSGAYLPLVATFLIPAILRSYKDDKAKLCLGYMVIAIAVFAQTFYSLEGKFELIERILRTVFIVITVFAGGFVMNHFMKKTYIKGDI